MNRDRSSLVLYVAAPLIVTSAVVLAASSQDWILVGIFGACDVATIIFSVTGAFFLGQLLEMRKAIAHVEELEEFLARVKRQLDPRHVEGPS